MTALEEPQPRDWWTTVIRVALLVAVLVAAGIFLPWWAPVAAALIGLPLLVRWHAKTYGYRCPNCGTTFVVSTVQDALALSGFTTAHPVKRVRCPSCGTCAFMRVLVRRRDN